MISGIGEIICTHAVAGSFHQNRVSKKEHLNPVSKLSMRCRLQSIHLETDSPFILLNIKGVYHSLCPSKRLMHTLTDLGQAPWQIRCKNILSAKY